MLASVALCCYLTDKWLEGVAFVVAHLALRYKFRFQYHSKHHCFELTNFIIWASIPMTAPMEYSLLASIPIAFFVCWVGNEEQEKIWLAIQCRKLKQEIKDLKSQLPQKQEFDVDNCTREAMEARCKEIGLNEKNTQLAIRFFVERTSLWKIAEELDIEYDSVNKRKKRLKSKLKY